MYFNRAHVFYLAINRDLLESGHETKRLLELLRGPVLRDEAGKVGAGHSENGADVVAKTVNAKIVDLKGRVLARSDLVEGGSLGRIEECVNHVWRC